MMLDPIVIEIVRGALRAVQGEMEALIERTAMSAFIREKKDFHAALFDVHGRLVATKSLPPSSDLIAPILEQYPAAAMRKGDLYWYNDCYASRGAVSHTPDQVLVAPVFEGDALVGFVQAWAHFGDVGGMHPGSISPQCTEIFQEGIIVPPTRLASEGRFNDDLLRLFIRNSRFPAAARGDMGALVAAVRLGERRIEELVERFGAARLQAVFDELIVRTRGVILERFRALVPNGSYRFGDTIDSDGHGHGPIHIRWRLDVTPERIVLDASDSDDQVRGPVNYLMSRTEPALTFGSYLLGDSREHSLNAGAEGLFDEVTLRDGSILHPRFPAALGQRGLTKQRNMASYLGLLGVATQGQAPAAQSAYVIWTFRGRDDEGEPFLMSDGVAVGWGARPSAEGHDAVYLVAQENYPVEFIEASYPIRVRRYGINPDTGGPGRWRGGCGVVRELEIRADEVMLAVRIDSVDNPPWGVAGGRCAGSGRCIVNPGRPDERVLAPLSDGNVLRRGDVVRLETGGGGGWGHPFDREPDRVLADVLAGFVSRDAAERYYGVVLAADAPEVDADATRRRRKARPPAKLFHRHEYLEALL
jgi:N-methylhydantoinase B